MKKQPLTERFQQLAGIKPIYGNKLNENISMFTDYVSSLYDADVEEKEGFQSGIWEKEEIRDSFPTLNSERDVLNLITDTWIDIYDKEAFEIHMPNHIFSIRANCPWDIEHGIEIEIKLEDIEAVTNK